MRKSRISELCLLAASLLTLLPVSAKDLPFAPPRKKPTNPIVFLPSGQEAITAKLDIGWKLDSKIDAPKKLVAMKFIPPEGNEDYSPKMINFATFIDGPGKDSAHDFAMSNRKTAEKMIPKGQLTWNMVYDDPTECMFEFSVKGWHDAPDQFEVERVMKGRDGVHVVVYHLDKPDPTEAERQQMIAFLKSVKVVDKAEYLNSTKSGATASVPAASVK